METLRQMRRFLPLLRIAIGFTLLLALFLSGIFPVEDLLSSVSSTNLTASVVPAEVATLTNEEREKNGVPTLSVSPLLTQAAQLKADDMADNSYYAHVSPDGKSPLYWLEKVGYKYLNAGENLVIDRSTSEQAVEAWMDSTDHRENILRPQFTEIGVGVAEGEYEGQKTIYVVQEFGTPYPLSINTPKVAVQPKPQPTVVVTTQVQTKASTTTPRPSHIEPILSVAALPKTQIVTNVNVLTAPIVHSIAPVTAPKPVIVVQPSTSTVASTTIRNPATSTITFALAPEFFTPVSLAEDSASDTQLAAPAGNSSFAKPTVLARITSYVRHIFSIVPRVW